VEDPGGRDCLNELRRTTFRHGAVPHLVQMFRVEMLLPEDQTPKPAPGAEKVGTRCPLVPCPLA